MCSTTYSEKIVDFVENLTYRDIPREVREKAKIHTLDAIGVALACKGMDFADSVVNLVLSLGGMSESTVWGYGEKASTLNAALANATMTHGLDFDDTHTKSVIHVSVNIIPTVLTLAESLGIGGEEIIAAIVAGYEVLTRIGMATPNKFHLRGFHPTSVCGVFGDAAVAGKVLCLKKEELINALGIAGSMSSGIFEYLSNGSWVKRLHPGWATHSGITAALLASKGFTGPRTVFEGKYGLYRTYLGEDAAPLGELIDGLGVNWETLNISLKPYPACHLTHAFLDCVLKLKGEYGIDPEDVEKIECLVPRGELGIICEPEEWKLRPTTDYDAKFSLHFTVATALVRGSVGIDDFTLEAVRDSSILRVTDKVGITPINEPDYPKHFPGWVKIRMRDGRIYEHRQRTNRGGPDCPMSEHEVREKFRKNASRALPEAKVEDLMRVISSLENLGNAADLSELLS